jgi:olefin beta-lactone synthetase
MGYINTNNHLFLLGRCKQAIQSNNHGVIYPFISEAVLLEIAGIKAGTVLKIENKLFAAIVVSQNTSEIDLSNAIKVKLPYIDEVVPIEMMPFDKRHHTKIDYDLLTEIINKKLEG